MLSLPTHACLTTPNPRLPTMAGTHRCSSYPSNSQERSTGPSIPSIGNALVRRAATRGLLGDHGVALSCGHCVCCRHLWQPSGGCKYMAWWPGCAAWLSAWPVPMLGQAWVQWRLLQEAADSDSSGPPRPLQCVLIRDVLNDRFVAWCARVETWACNRASTGVMWGAVEVRGLVCSGPVGSAQPRKGTKVRMRRCRLHDSQ